MTIGKLLGTVAWYIGLVVIVVLALAPIAWMLSTSFKPEGQITTFDLAWIPRTFTLANYEAVLQKYAILRWMFNSIFVAVVATAFTVLLAALAGYALARMQFFGRALLFSVIVSMLFVPVQITAVPLFLLFSRLGMTDTFAALILPVGANVTGVFLMRQFFLSIPSELEDAGRVDGASAFRIWRSIILPLARPALTAVAIITFLSTWNSFFWPLIVTRSDAVRTLPVGVGQFMALVPGQSQAAQVYGQSMAGSVIAALPPIIMFLLLQRNFIRGISLTGLKG